MHIDYLRTRYGLLLIADEVQTGFGRTGSMFASDWLDGGVNPDILVMAKGIANGYVMHTYPSTYTTTHITTLVHTYMQTHNNTYIHYYSSWFMHQQLLPAVLIHWYVDVVWYHVLILVMCTSGIHSPPSPLDQT